MRQKADHPREPNQVIWIILKQQQKGRRMEMENKWKEEKDKTLQMTDFHGIIQEM